MTVTSHAVSTATYHDTITDIGSNTNRRDVSELLDLWCHKETPFLNRLSWGAESGGLNIEWISEHLGYGYVTVASASTATASTDLTIGSSDLSTTTLAAAQITTGSLLFSYDSTNAEMAILFVNDISGVSIDFDYLVTGNLTVDTKLYILGSVANEGSAPRTDRSRTREQITNNMMILREDVQITGSMAATDMYAVEDELKHQVQLRLKEMQRHREMSILLATTQARSGTAAGVMKGAYGFLSGQSGEHIKATAQDFTETSVNDMAIELYENGSTPNCLVGSVKQLRKFTSWDRAKVRTTPDAKMGGHHVASYLTDAGIEIDLVPMRKFPTNMVFMLDDASCVPRAKKGRKLILEKLGIDGDRERWQMISEFSLEMKGYDKGAQGMWSHLNT